MRSIRSTIRDLDAQKTDLAAQDEALAAALRELPSTL